MRLFYNYERFDIDYIADVAVFTKADPAPSSGNNVVITQPGNRQRGTSIKNL